MNELRDDIQDHVLPATPCATMNENKSHKRWSSQAMYVIKCANFPYTHKGIEPKFCQLSNGV